eukprot:CAMPEP_0184855404 /NCGR_PEP_ID=MMETSP0580-20130426/671_1 /TAXON_ID=1118495 /ORGANISM="Dactyliosolen fragilissimus" /LENGTH=365 /DNA_ID=CAMNT_0027349915 /DNA_START=480 /DNA_END=1577 /DNA_ORIENTATION=+
MPSKFNHGPPLVDADLNLSHSDMQSLLTDSINPMYDGIHPMWKVLHHPSTTNNQENNLVAAFVPSSTLDEAEELLDVLYRSSDSDRNGVQIRMGVGVHPYHTSIEESGDPSDSNISSRFTRLVDIGLKGGKSKDDVSDERIQSLSCVGELGLDYTEGFPDKKFQLPWCEFQVKLAVERGLPMFIHERNAIDDMIQILDSNLPHTQMDASNEDDSILSTSPPVLIHCFTGSRDECKEYIRRGYFLSVSGFILKPAGSEVCDCIRDGILPLNKLLIETDAPYMGFQACRTSYYNHMLEEPEFVSLNSKKKKRLLKGIYPNVPSSLALVLDKVTELIDAGNENRGEQKLGRDYVANMIYDNSVRFFRL